MNDIVKFSQFGQAQALSGAERVPFQSGSINAVFTLTQLAQFVRQSLGLGDAATANKTDFDGAGVADGFNTLSVQRDDALSERMDHLQQDIDNAKNGANSYRTLALANAAVAAGDIPANTSLRVTVDPDTTKNGLYDYDGLTLEKSNSDELTQAKSYADSKKNEAVAAASTDASSKALIAEKNVKTAVFSQTGKNLFDKNQIVAGSQFSPSQNKIIAAQTYRRAGFMPVTAGATYTLSGNNSGSVHTAWYATADVAANALSYSTTRTAIAPAGANFAVINVTNTGGSDTTYDSTTQFEIGSVATAYEAYKKLIAQTDVNGLTADLAAKVAKAALLEDYSFNLIDPTKCNYAKRYSTGTKNFITDTLGIAASDYIAVTAGEWYALSGEYYGNTATPQGGYFTAYGAATAVQNIDWAKPVDNVGHAFKVPTGLGITHVVFSLKKLNADPAATALNGNVQLEKGEMTTAYQAYALKQRVKPALITSAPTSGGSTSTGFDNAAWYKYVLADSPTIYPTKLPNFRKHMLLKDKDVVVVNVGTSLTARTSEHSTLRSDAAFRPPMMHSNAFCSHVWDALIKQWQGQQYRRYDAATSGTNFFIETGTFATSSSLTEWDDGAARDGLTRYSSSANAAVQFTVPIDAWQFNFIYRSGSLGCTAKIVVAEGIGKLQVYDDATSAWVEANNYTFSQLEAAPVTRSVNIPNPVTGANTATTLASKGNTTYQKRLKMRCRSSDGTFDSRASTKSVTISNSSNSGTDRLLYWGVEWSPRQFMLTYINSARGSHNTNASGAAGLPRFQDNEVWSFKPDLILGELAIHNDGAAAAGIYPIGQWAGLTHNYVTNTSYELSLYSRAAYFSQTPEYAFFVGTITWNFGGISDAGQLLYGLQTASVKGNARAMSALDKYAEAIQFLRENYPDIPALNTAQRWCDAGFAIFGDMQKATVGSGKDGATFTNEGSHWNDTGSRIIAKAVIPLIL